VDKQLSAAGEHFLYNICNSRTWSTYV